MIVYDLSCICGCQFEGWFQSGEDFENQLKSGLLYCPDCKGKDVKKILSPVSVKSSSRLSHDQFGKISTSEVEEAAARVLKNIQDYVIREYTDVGPKLARESLEMKYGLKEPRNIRGVSTPEEEKVLKEEGIELIKIPLPAKEDGTVN